MLTTTAALWCLVAGASCLGGGEVPVVPLVSGPGEAQAFAIEVGGASVGTWQCRVVAGAPGRLVLGAQMTIDPLLAAFLPARARMEVQVSDSAAGATGGLGVWEALMHRQRSGAEDEVRWRYTGTGADEQVSVVARRLAGPPRPSTRWTSPPQDVWVDPLTAFFMLRQGAGAATRCLQVATHDGPWVLRLAHAGEASIKTPVGFRVADHYRLSYRPVRPHPGARPVEGELWQARDAHRLIYEVRLAEPVRVRATLTTYQRAPGARR